jgi:hypothetical protein
LSEEAYRTSVRSAYEGEIVGERLYRALSAEDTDGDRRHKLLTISRVEAVTHQRLQPVAARLGIEPAEASIESSVQHRLAQLRQLSWETLIAKAVAEWPAYLGRFEMLRRSAASADAAALQSLVDHEYALVRFALLEYDSPGSDRSLRPLLASLGEEST